MKYLALLCLLMSSSAFAQTAELRFVENFFKVSSSSTKISEFADLARLIAEMKANRLRAPNTEETLSFYLNKLGCSEHLTSDCIAKAAILGQQNDKSWQD